MRVEDCMTQELHTCDTRDSLNSAARIMWEHECGCVPIVDGEYKLVGMITDRDVAMAAYTQGKQLAEIAVVDAMARRLFSCEGRTSVVSAQEVMREHGLRRLPVIDATGKLTGLVTLSDLARAAARAGDAPDRERVEHTLAAVLEHHARHS